MPRNLVLADADTGYEIVSWLIDNYKSDLALVVTTQANDISDRCRKAGVPTEVYTDESTIADALLAQREPIDLGFTVWWPKLVRQPLLRLPRRGFVNTHPSLLPHGRGKHYNFWTIVEEAPFGVSLHLLDEGVDTGPIIAQEEISYSWEDTGETLYRAAQRAIPRLFRNSYERICRGDVNRSPQDPDAGSFHRAKELDAASLIELDRQYTGRELLNLLRARSFPGFPGCRFVDHERTFEVHVQIKEVKP